MATANTKIEWTEATWNPVTGCTKISEGCRNCYALFQGLGEMLGISQEEIEKAYFRKHSINYKRLEETR